MENEIKLMQTKKGNGYKIVVDGQWFYASREALLKVIDEGWSCNFRTIEDDDEDAVSNEEKVRNGDESASAAQIALLRRLKVKELPAGLTKVTASEMIDAAKAGE